MGNQRAKVWETRDVKTVEDVCNGSDVEGE